MARNRGTFNFASNFEVLTKAPLDARSIVSLKADLISSSIWEDANNNSWVYTGMLVSVAHDTSINNGVYFLKDAATFTTSTSWLKISSEGIDNTGTDNISWQINNTDEGVILKDASGNLDILKYDAVTYAGLKAGDIEVSSLKIDNLTGSLYVLDGSVYAVDGVPIKTFNGAMSGNGITTEFTVDHSLNTIKQNMTIYDLDNDIIYPELERGLNTNKITFSSPPLSGDNYEIIIIGF